MEIEGKKWKTELRKQGVKLNNPEKHEQKSKNRETETKRKIENKSRKKQQTANGKQNTVDFKHFSMESKNQKIKYLFNDSGVCPFATISPER